MQSVIKKSLSSNVKVTLAYSHRLCGFRNSGTPWRSLKVSQTLCLINVISQVNFKGYSYLKKKNKMKLPRCINCRAVIQLQQITEPLETYFLFAKCKLQVGYQMQKEFYTFDSNMMLRYFTVVVFGLRSRTKSLPFQFHLAKCSFCQSLHSLVLF